MGKRSGSAAGIDTQQRKEDYESQFDNSSSSPSASTGFAVASDEVLKARNLTNKTRRKYKVKRVGGTIDEKPKTSGGSAPFANLVLTSASPATTTTSASSGSLFAQSSSSPKKKKFSLLAQPMSTSNITWNSAETNGVNDSTAATNGSSSYSSNASTNDRLHEIAALNLSFSKWVEKQCREQPTASLVQGMLDYIKHAKKVAETETAAKPATIAATPSTSSLFSKSSNTSQEDTTTLAAGNSSMFASNSKESTNLFDKPSVTASSSSSLFGKTSDNTASSSNRIGKSAESAALSSSLFGKPKESPTPPASSGGLFGKPSDSTSPTTNLFGKPSENASSGNLFGSKNETKSESGGLFGNSAMPSSTAGGSLFSGSLFSSGSTPATTTGTFSPFANSASGTGASEVNNEDPEEPQEEASEVRKAEDESEEQLHECRAKFYWMNDNNEWAKSGVGRLVVLRNKNDDKRRIVIRTEGTGKVQFNASIYKGMPVTLDEKNGMVNVVTINYREDAETVPTKPVVYKLAVKKVSAPTLFEKIKAAVPE